MVHNENEGPKHVAYRSAITGNFVTKEFAERHPHTTYKDSIPDHVASVSTQDDAEDETAHEAKAAETAESETS